MAQGENAINFVTKNIHLCVTSSLVSDTQNSRLKIPASPDEMAYGVLPTTLTLGPNGLSDCPDIGDYTQVSVLLWMTIPFANSSVCQTPMMTIGTVKQSSENTPKTSDNNTDNDTANNLKSSGQRYRISGIPAYTLTIQFPKKEDFNFTAAVNFTNSKRSTSRVNFTMPACTKYNGVSYESCKGCNVSSYTNYNVTYTCFDVRQICPVTTGSLYGRRNLHENNNENENKNEENGNKIYNENESNYGNENRNGVIKNINNGRKRKLSHNRNRILDTTITPTANSYSVLTDSIFAEVKNVITINPLNLDLDKSKVVLSFVGCFTGFIFIMLVYLVQRDRTEKIQKIYVKTENEKLARKLLEEDIKNGKRGDHGAIYQNHLSACKSAMIKNSGIVKSLQRTAMSNSVLYFKGLFIRKKQYKDGAIYPSNYVKPNNKDTIPGMESKEDDGSGNFSFDNNDNRNSLRMNLSPKINKYPSKKNLNSNITSGDTYDSFDTDRLNDIINKHNNNNNNYSNYNMQYNPNNNIHKNKIYNNNKDKNDDNMNNKNYTNKDNNYFNDYDYDDEYIYDENDDSNAYYNNGATANRQSYRAGAVIVEFMQRLFPGHAIYKNKTNALYIIALNHDYFKMFAGSTMTRSRTIRFLDLVILVLVTIFVDTVFFGVFFPVNACELNIDQVNIILRF